MYYFYIYFYSHNVCTVYRSNLLALYSFYPPEPKCITQSKMQMSQINFAKEPNLAPEPQKWTTLTYWNCYVYNKRLTTKIKAGKSCF